MINEIIKEGPSVPEALDAALEEMGVQQDSVQYEVLQEGGRGFFGAGSKLASVRVWLKPGVVAEVAAKQAEPAVEEDVVLEEEAPLTDEELDKIADEAVGVVNGVLAALGIESEIEEYEGDDNEIILDIVGDDLGVLIGRHGKTLDALQVLVAAMTNRKIGRRFPVVVDVSGYRYRRKLKLEEIAHRAADRVARQGRPVELRPMTSFERKAVHVALRNDPRVNTASEGDEPYRQVVVHPK